MQRDIKTVLCVSFCVKGCQNNIFQNILQKISNLLVLGVRGAKEDECTFIRDVFFYTFFTTENTFFYFTSNLNIISLSLASSKYIQLLKILIHVN